MQGAQPQLVLVDLRIESTARVLKLQVVKGHWMIADPKRSYRSLHRQKSLQSLADVAHTRKSGFVEAAETASKIAVGNIAFKGHRGDRHQRNREEKNTTPRRGNQQNEGNFKSNGKDPKTGQ